MKLKEIWLVWKDDQNFLDHASWNLADIKNSLFEADSLKQELEAKSYNVYIEHWREYQSIDGNIYWEEADG